FRIKESAGFSLEITTRLWGSPPQDSTTRPRDARRGSRLSASTVCPVCGTTNPSSNAFCVNCGTRLGAAGVTAPGALAAGAPPAVPPPVAPYPGGYPYYAPPFPRRATFSDMLSGMFDVYTKNFLPIFVTGAMTEYAIRRYRGEPMAVEQALRRGLARFPSILGANILLGLILFGLVTIPLLLIAVALLAGLSGATGTIALLCGGLILFVVLGVLAIFLYVSLVLYTPAILLEHACAVGGLSRSW